MDETITCKCGHTDTLRTFTVQQPWGVYRCPACKYRWHRALENGRVVLRECIPWPWQEDRA